MMKQFYTIILMALFGSFANAQIINFPDANLKARLVNTFCASFTEGVPSSSYSSRVDTNSDGEIDLNEALAVKGLRINTSPLNTTNDIVSLEGLQYFTNLQRFDCGGNQIQNIDVSTMLNLLELNCPSNVIENLSISGLPNLDLIRCYSNNIATLNLTNLPMLHFFEASRNNLTSLDVTGLPSLISFVCSNNQISNLVVHDMPDLQEIAADNNQLTSVNLNGLIHLTDLMLSDNLLTNFSPAPIPHVVHLNLSNNAISTLNINGFTDLQSLSVNNTLLTQIDCSQTGLWTLSCSDNPNLTSINIKNGWVSLSDPDLLYYSFQFENLPLLTSICLDLGEENNLFYTNFNSGGNAVIYTGADCSIVVPLSTKTFGISDDFVVYPNPVTNILHVKSATNNALKTVTITNVFGQVVLTDFNPIAGKTIDVARLSAGTYFITATSDNGNSTKKFIKI